MEKITKFKNLIDEALAQSTVLKTYFLGRENVWNDTSIIVRTSPEIIEDAKERLIELQNNFIETRSKADNSTAFLKKELERIEGVFSLPTFSFVHTTPVFQGKKPIRIESTTYHYDFTNIEEDLQQGRIKGDARYGLISHLLATANFYLWLKELAAQPSNEETEEFRQIWLNPAEDIPFVLQALKDLDFIDENEVWRLLAYSNPLGFIDALTDFKKRVFFAHSLDDAGHTPILSKTVLVKMFAERFKFPSKRYEPKNGPYNLIYQKTRTYLKNSV